MLTIWKFPLLIVPEQSVLMPYMNLFRALAYQGDQLCLWALVDAARETVPVRVWIRGTGEDVEDLFGRGRYVGTAIDPNASLVWHVFLAVGEPQ